MTWKTQPECPECDPCPMVREVELDRTVASNGVVFCTISCADCGHVIDERLGFDVSAARVSVSDFSWLSGEDVVTRDDVR